MWWAMDRPHLAQINNLEGGIFHLHMSFVGILGKKKVSLVRKTSRPWNAGRNNER